MALLMDKIMDEKYELRKKSLDQKKAETLKGKPENKSDAEWNEYIRKKAIEDMRKAGAKLASASKN
ncbi:MAG: hypothetical protein ABIF85_06605 [Nanoarchaeota archaeon]|nr:hypothetical protein [Nanoarchaeota archaeon]MBU4451320.1 hypothetical protein [Nanoarchaeota archaeon]MCG2723281.1 hypothetical protein [archaeon]